MKKFEVFLAILCVFSLIISCVSINAVKIVKGEKGDKGEQGIAGLDGKDGVNGVDGKDGKDGINGLDGEDGKDGINGTDGKDGRDGLDGLTPYIGEDGMWYIGENCLNVKATETITEIITKTVYSYKNYNLMWADSPEFWETITKKGAKIPYLVVYNCSDNTGGGCWDSYVLPCAEKQQYDKDIIYYRHAVYGENISSAIQYLNLSCFLYEENKDYSQYVVNCTNRTSPGEYKKPGQDNGLNWEDAPYGVGVYILKNVEIQSWHNTTTTYGGTPLSQTVLTYEAVYTPYDLLMEGI